jgi:hypothetical protein
MPTVQQLLTQVDDQYPNSFTDAQLLNWGNEILRKVWKFMNEDEIYTFSLVANQAIYSLPSDGLAVDKIDVVEVATDSSLNYWKPYFFKGLLDTTEKSTYFYDAYNSNFGIYPAPDIAITDGGRIFYGAKFSQMSASALTVVPRVNEDYHSLIVNYMCMKAAESGNNPDIESRNNFASNYNDDWKKLMFDYTRIKCKMAKKKRCNNWW